MAGVPYDGYPALIVPRRVDYAATKCAITGKALADTLVFTGFGGVMTVPIFCDNKSAVMLSDSATSSKRLKHVATRIAFLRELVQSKTIALYHISTTGQVADIFTKPLSAQTFHGLRILML